MKREILEHAEKLGITREKSKKLLDRSIQRFVDAYPHLNHIQKMKKQDERKEENADAEKDGSKEGKL